MTAQPIDPLGEAYEIRHNDFRLRVREVGAVLEGFERAGTPIIDGPDPRTELADVFKGSRGAVLIPWPNRVSGGKYSFEGASLQLAIGEVANGNAIHGFARWASWTAEQHESRVVLRTLLHAHQGYPFVIEASVGCELTDEGLEVTMAGTNRGDGPAPFGMGAHPYVRTESERIDADTYTSPATQYYEVDDKQIPKGEPLPTTGGPLDFTAPRSLEGVKLDTCFTGLQRGEDGIARFDVTNPNGAVVTVWMDETFDYAMVFTGDGLGRAEERRRGIAIEPMSCAPDAFNNGAGLAVLQPGETLSGKWGISVS